MLKGLIKSKSNKEMAQEHSTSLRAPSKFISPLCPGYSGLPTRAHAVHGGAANQATGILHGSGHQRHLHRQDLPIRLQRSVIHAMTKTGRGTCQSKRAKS